MLTLILITVSSVTYLFCAGMFYGAAKNLVKEDRQIAAIFWPIATIFFVGMWSINRIMEYGQSCGKSLSGINISQYKKWLFSPNPKDLAAVEERLQERLKSELPYSEFVKKPEKTPSFGHKRRA